MSEHDWSPKEQALLGAALFSNIADVVTTKSALKRGALETNKLLGRNPSDEKLNASLALNSLLVSALAGTLPKENRAAFLGAWTGFKSALAAQNTKTDKKTGPKSFGEGVKVPAASAVIGYLLAKHLGEMAEVRMTKDDEGAKLSLSMRF